MALPRRLLFALAAFCLLLPLAGPAQEEERIRQSTEELERIRSRMAELQRSLERDRGQKDELRGQLQDAEKRITEVLDKLKQLQRSIADQDQRVASTKLERARESRRLEGQRETLARQIRSAYLIGHQAKTKLILNQEDPALLTRVVTYYDYLNKARADRIRAIQLQIEAFNALELRLGTEMALLGSLKQQQELALSQLERSRAERSQALAKLVRRIRDKDKELKLLAADEQSLQELLESLRSVLADIPLEIGTDKRFAELKGTLPWPARGKLLAAFGDAKAGGKMKWNGLWIDGKPGTPVKAVAHGRVAYVGWMHRYGLIVVIEHEDGYFTLYGHNQSVARSVGEWVEAGDLVAAAGDTGGHDQAGVYFELRKGPEPMDPRGWLAH